MGNISVTFEYFNTFNKYVCHCIIFLFMKLFLYLKQLVLNKSNVTRDLASPSQYKHYSISEVTERMP